MLRKRFRFLETSRSENRTKEPEGTESTRHEPFQTMYFPITRGKIIFLREGKEKNVSRRTVNAWFKTFLCPWAFNKLEPLCETSFPISFLRPVRWGVSVESRNNVLAVYSSGQDIEGKRWTLYSVDKRIWRGNSSARDTGITRHHEPPKGNRYRTKLVFLFFFVSNGRRVIKLLMGFKAAAIEAHLFSEISSSVLSDDAFSFSDRPSSKSIP